MTKNNSSPRKVYGRTARLAAIADALKHNAAQLPDICIDMLYSVLLSFLTPED